MSVNITPHSGKKRKCIPDHTSSRKKNWSWHDKKDTKLIRMRQEKIQTSYINDDCSR